MDKCILVQKFNLAMIHEGIKSATKEIIYLAPRFANATVAWLPKAQEKEHLNFEEISII